MSSAGCKGDDNLGWVDWVLELYPRGISLFAFPGCGERINKTERGGLEINDGDKIVLSRDNEVLCVPTSVERSDGILLLYHKGCPKPTNKQTNKSHSSVPHHISYITTYKVHLYSRHRELQYKPPPRYSMCADVSPTGDLASFLP